MPSPTPREPRAATAPRPATSPAQPASSGRRSTGSLYGTPHQGPEQRGPQEAERPSPAAKTGTPVASRSGQTGCSAGSGTPLRPLRRRATRRVGVSASEPLAVGDPQLHLRPSLEHLGRERFLASIFRISLLILGSARTMAGAKAVPMGPFPTMKNALTPDLIRSSNWSRS
jgi:hypothetical protein